MAARIVLRPGERFNRLVFVKETRRKSNSGGLIGTFLCDCGNSIDSEISVIRRGRTVSCGCYQKQIVGSINKSHGLSNSPEYLTWLRIRDRCRNNRNNQYRNYGGRGVSVCERWDRFENFLSDMGNKPTQKHQIDRIDNNGDYEPSNCRWATCRENCENTRKSKFWIVHGIRYQSAQDASKALNVCKSTIRRWCEGRYINGTFEPPMEGCFSEKKYQD